MQETWVQFLGWENPLEKEMETHSSILVWRTPWSLPGSSVHGIYNLLANICQVLTVLQLWLDAVVEVKVVKVICSVVSDSLQPHGL